MVTAERGRSGRRAGMGPQARPTARQVTGNQAEQRALDHLMRQGLRLVERNYRLAGGPFARGAEIDLILREPDGTLVFVEVRARSGGSDGLGGGAAASVTAAKQRRIVRAAQHYLLRWPQLPPCRFDVVAVDGERLQWLRAAFEAG